jgi:endonuclease/exonuclease/phosphatase family metal-dependent hydrolase
VDDSSRAGGLPNDALFVVMGDQNADPDEGDTYQQPIRLLLDHERVQGDVVPTASFQGQAAYPDLDPDDTAAWGLRVDYVLPSVGLPVAGSGVWRPVGADTAGVPVSDHFPVWIDLAPER